MFDGIDGVVDSTRPARCLAVMHEIAHTDGPLKGPSNGGGARVRTRTAGSIEDKPFVEPVVVLGPIEHHPHQRFLVFGLENLPCIGKCNLLRFATSRRLHRSSLTVQPSERSRDTVLTEGAIPAHRTIA